MLHYPYLIVGGGITADSAIRGIREIDSSSSIGVISSENHLPYNRPPLSKSLWKGEALQTIWRKQEASDVSYHLSETVRSIDPGGKSVTDAKGNTYSYGKLLLATGVRVRRMASDAEGIVYFRTLDDYQALRDMSNASDSFVVIGGGFIGSEIAAALAMNNKSALMMFSDAGISARVFPKSLSLFLNSYFQEKGVRIQPNDGVASVKKNGERYEIRTLNRKRIECDAIVAGIGVEPNQELAAGAGLDTENGIVVDEFLRTSNADIYAAGDVANFPNASLNTRTRVEHEDNANVMGRTAGHNMAGKEEPYTHLPFFYSDLFDLGYEAVGELNPQYEIVEDWKDRFHEGVVYYLQAQRVRGVLLWNTWGQVDAARALIGAPGPFNARNLTGRLPAA